MRIWFSFYSGRVNTNFGYGTRKNLTVYAKSWKWCVQRTQKAEFGLNTSQNTHEANDHVRDASIEKGKRASFAHNISVFRWIVWQRCFWNAPFILRHPFHFVGAHFRIFVRKFLVHLRTVYASPQKLARPLFSKYVLFFIPRNVCWTAVCAYQFAGIRARLFKARITLSNR